MSTLMDSLYTLKSLTSMEFLLFFLRKFSQLHALLEPPRLLISEKSTPSTVFHVINMKKFPPPRPYLNLHVYSISDISSTYTFLKLHAYQRLQSIKKTKGFHMRYHFFLYYGCFLQNLRKDFIRTNMHTTVCQLKNHHNTLFFYGSK